MVYRISHVWSTRKSTISAIRRISLALVLAVVAGGQTPAPLRSAVCPGTTAKLLVFVPVAGGRTVPTCVDVAALVQPAPKMAIETIPLLGKDALVTLDFTLAKRPAPGTALLIVIDGTVGNGLKVFFPTGADMRILNFTLPEHRPFTAADVVTVAYWSLE